MVDIRCPGAPSSLPRPVVSCVDARRRSQARYLESLGARYTIRKSADGRQFATDSGNMILDCHFGSIADARQLADALARRAGIVEHGLFIGLTTDLMVGGAGGVQHQTRKV